MRKTLIAALMIIFSFTQNSFAGSATPDECIAKCRQAALMIKTKGLETAIEEINKKDGQFVWKDSYVFMMDTDGKMLAHPIKPALVGKNLLEVKDSNGKALFRDFIQMAKTSGSGWVDYMWPRPGEDKPTPKSSFILKVDDNNLIMGAGIYK